MLSGTLAVELADELRFAEDIKVDGGGELLSYTSCRLGTGVNIVNDPASGHVVIEDSDIWLV